MSTLKSSAEDLTLNADGANNDIILQSNGSTKVTLDGQNSRLGIGTTSPSVRLDVDADTTAVIAQLTTDSSDAAVLKITNEDGTDQTWGVAVAGSAHATGNDSFYIRDESRGLNRLIIDSSGDVKVNTGNLVIGTAGKGIDFSAATDLAGMTSELLDDYEEGTFTPVYAVVGGGSHSSVSIKNTGTYIKVGRMCHIGIQSYIVSTTGTVTSYTVTLPFAGAANTVATGHGDEFAQGTGGCKLQIAASAATMTIKENDAGSMPGNAYLALGITYQTV